MVWLRNGITAARWTRVEKTRSPAASGTASRRIRERLFEKVVFQGITKALFMRFFLAPVKRRASPAGAKHVCAGYGHAPPAGFK
jgi:hypothetical protein